jgi:hypothetical protein
MYVTPVITRPLLPKMILKKKYVSNETMILNSIDVAEVNQRGWTFRLLSRPDKKEIRWSRFKCSSFWYFAGDLMPVR